MARPANSPCPERRPGAVLRKFTERAVRIDRKAAQLRQLADHHRQRDAVHISISDRFGEQFGHEPRGAPNRPECRSWPDTTAIMLARATAAQGSPPESGRTTPSIMAARKIRTKHQNSLGPNTRIDGQRNDGRVKSINAGHAGRHRVGYADRRQHGRENQPPDDVVGERRGPGNREGRGAPAPIASSRIGAYLHLYDASPQMMNGASSFVNLDAGSSTVDDGEQRGRRASPLVRKKFLPICRRGNAAYRRPNEHQICSFCYGDVIGHEPRFFGRSAGQGLHSRRDRRWHRWPLCRPPHLDRRSGRVHRRTALL